jgi:hypothetical protein
MSAEDNDIEGKQEDYRLRRRRNELALPVTLLLIVSITESGLFSLLPCKRWCCNRVDFT